MLGMCAFREAIAYDDVGRDQRYVTAASYLREADRLSLAEERRPEWAFATGISLYRIGRADEAQPLLKEAVETYPPGKNEAGLLLTQVYMDGRSKHNMEAGAGAQLDTDRRRRPANGRPRHRLAAARPDPAVARAARGIGTGA